MLIELKLITTGQVLKIEIPEEKFEALDFTILDLKKLLAPKLGLIPFSASQAWRLTIAFSPASPGASTVALSFCDTQNILKLFSELPSRFSFELNFTPAIPPLLLSSDFPSSPPADISPIQWTHQEMTQGRTTVWDTEKLPITMALSDFLQSLFLTSVDTPRRFVTYYLISATIKSFVLGYAVFSSDKLSLYQSMKSQTSPGKGIDLKELHWIPNTNLAAFAPWHSALESSFSAFVQAINLVFPSRPKTPIKTILETEQKNFSEYLQKQRGPSVMFRPMSSADLSKISPEDEGNHSPSFLMQVWRALGMSSSTATRTKSSPAEGRPRTPTPS